MLLTDLVQKIHNKWDGEGNFIVFFIICYKRWQSIFYCTYSLLSGIFYILHNFMRFCNKTCCVQFMYVWGKDLIFLLYLEKYSLVLSQSYHQHFYSYWRNLFMDRDHFHIVGLVGVALYWKLLCFVLLLFHTLITYYFVKGKKETFQYMKRVTK